MKASNIDLVTVLTAIVTFGFLATGAIILIDGDKGMEKIGLLFAFFATIVPSLVSALHSAKAREQTNGSLDARIERGVYRAQAVRRREIMEEDRPTSPLEGE